MKRIIALIMALALVMGLAITASAAGISITPSDTQTGNVLDITYKAIKIFDAEIIEGGVTYSVPNDDSNFVTKLLANVDSPKTKDGTDFYFTKTLSADGSKYYIVPTELATKEDAEVLVNHLLATINRATVEIDIPYVDGKFINESLTPGYYFVYSNAGSNAIVETLGEIVEIKNKNEYPTVTKQVNGQDSVTVDEGNEVTFTVTIQLPDNNYGSGTYMTLHDTCEGVVIDKNSVVVTWDDLEHPVVPVVNALCTQHALDVTFAFNVFPTDPETHANTVTVTYTGTVNALDSEEGEDTIATNTAWITLHPAEKPDDPYYESVKDTVTMSNAKFEIFKYTPGAEGAKNPLAGAGFVVTKKDAENKTVYYQFKDGVVNWVSEIAEATEVVSGDNGLVVFEGLAAGEYVAVEKTVPAGYNKAADTPFTINTDDAGIAVDPLQVPVVNNTGSELPSTGGIGTTLFYVIGGLLMAGAAVLLITKKRMAA